MSDEAGYRVEAPRWVIPPGAVEEWAALDEALTGAEAACQAHPEAWWEPGSAETAKAACGRCPVRVECLAYALAADERFGVWGGLGPEERRAKREGVGR